MSKVRTFSRVFPSYHSKAGMPTFFVEKILHPYWTRIGFKITKNNLHEWFYRLNPHWDDLELDTIIPCILDYRKLQAEKHHTIRAGHHFKAGDKFSPRVWSGKPYQSKQIIIAPDLTITNTWNFRIRHDGVCRIKDYQKLSIEEIEQIANNDGLALWDFDEWFKLKGTAPFKEFDGQIICWNEKISY